MVYEIHPCFDDLILGKWIFSSSKYIEVLIWRVDSQGFGNSKMTGAEARNWCISSARKCSPGAGVLLQYPICPRELTSQTADWRLSSGAGGVQSLKVYRCLSTQGFVGQWGIKEGDGEMEIRAKSPAEVVPVALLNRGRKRIIFSCREILRRVCFWPGIMVGSMQNHDIIAWGNQSGKECIPSRELTYSPLKVAAKMIFLFHRWDMWSFPGYTSLDQTWCLTSKNFWISKIFTSIHSGWLLPYKRDYPQFALWGDWNQQPVGIQSHANSVTRKRHGSWRASLTLNSCSRTSRPKNKEVMSQVHGPRSRVAAAGVTRRLPFCGRMRPIFAVVEK